MESLLWNLWNLSVNKTMVVLRMSEFIFVKKYELPNWRVSINNKFVVSSKTTY